MTEMWILTVIVLIILIKCIDWGTSGTSTRYYYTKNGVRRSGKV